MPPTFNKIVWKITNDVLLFYLKYNCILKFDKYNIIEHYVNININININIIECFLKKAITLAEIYCEKKRKEILHSTSGCYLDIHQRSIKCFLTSNDIIA